MDKKLTEKQLNKHLAPILAELPDADAMKLTRLLREHIDDCFEAGRKAEQKRILETLHKTSAWRGNLWSMKEIEKLIKNNEVI